MPQNVFFYVFQAKWAQYLNSGLTLKSSFFLRGLCPCVYGSASKRVYKSYYSRQFPSQELKNPVGLTIEARGKGIRSSKWS